MGWEFLLVPAVVEIDKKSNGLKWQPGDVPRRQIADSRILDRFIALADAPDARILTFARRYGTLQLCKHALPKYHNWTTRRNLKLIEAAADGWEWAGRTLDWEELTGEPERCEVQQFEEVDPVTGLTSQWGWESLEVLRYYARNAKSIREVAERLRHGKLAPREKLLGMESEEDLRLLNMPTPFDGPFPQPVERKTPWQQTFVATHLQRWLELAKVEPEINWEGQTPQVVWRPSGLFGFLALRLAAEVTGSGDLATCDGCGKTYTRERKPDKSRRNFCADCREAKVPQKLAMQDMRERERREREQATDV